MESERSREQGSAVIQLLETGDVAATTADGGEWEPGTEQSEASLKAGGGRRLSEAGNVSGAMALCCDGYGYHADSSE